MKTIKLSLIINSNVILYRDTIKNIEKYLEKDTKYIDFSEIIFISPSSLHELLVLLNKYNLKLINVDEIFKEKINYENNLRKLNFNTCNLIQGC